MAHIWPEKMQSATLMSVEHEGPVRMLNLMRFRDKVEGDDLTGAEMYDRYLRSVVPLVERFGGKIVLSGTPLATVIGPVEERWDSMLIVEYPSLVKFMEMGQSAGYLAIAEQRSAALEDSRLIALSAD